MAEESQKSLLPIWKMLDAEGLKVDRVENNQPVVVDAQGQEFNLPVDELLKRDGLSRDQVDIEWNSPSAPVQQSPLDLTERFLTKGIGNTRGTIRYLKKSYEGVQYDKENGVVVKKDGVWHAVDPQYLGNGDAREKSKELFSDLVEGAFDIVGGTLSSAGAAVGGTAGALAGPGGAVAGGLAGASAGQAITSTIRTNLGRMFGTYDPGDSNEQLQDIGMDALMALGGQALGVGAKATIPLFAKGVGKIVSTASEGVKDMIGATVSKLTQAGEAATHKLFESPARVMSKAVQAVRSSGTVQAALEKIQTAKVSAMKGFFEFADKQLTSNYGDDLAKLIESSEGANLQIDFKDFSTNVLKELQDTGIGKVVTKTLPNGKQKIRFNFFSDKAVIKRVTQDLPTSSISQEEQRVLKNAVNKLTIFANSKINASGKGAAASLKRFERVLNDALEPAFDGSDTLKRAAAQIKQTYRNAVRQKFSDVGLETEYNALTNNYTKYIDSVREARKFVRAGDTTKIESFLNGLTQMPGKRVGQVGKRAIKDNLLELTGEKGASMLDEILTLHAAEKFAPIAPRMGLLQSVATGTAVSGKLGPVGTVALPGIVAASSPRLVGYGAQATAAVKKNVIDPGLKYATEGVHYLKNLPPDQLKSLLTSDQLMGRFFQAIGNANNDERQLTQGLLQNFGVVPNEQQPQ